MNKSKPRMMCSKCFSPFLPNEIVCRFCGEDGVEVIFKDPPKRPNAEVAVYEGDKYRETKDLDIAEVAKLIRKDLAGKREDDDSPLYGLKVSVQIQRYSMGQAIHLTAEVRSMDRERWQEIKDALFRAADRYNRVESDPLSDYHSAKFHVGTHIRAR